ncbi:DUF6407 family protein [Alkalihalobacillus sp. MEB130]|uniref:DUF6407 family protein n=1 Tax=Alkalihalobacillus sp. MEB130 TaxID=2976704 RepID=UPI0028E06F4B|nr:DUF6407 family protein [Alkalihalobacillus sp. MEB130]MDT8859678.1 DUF6407 family protein [Alkalihalobacillus sp. MEB130]
MGARKSFEDFVQDQIKKIEQFDCSKSEIKTIIKSAIQYYDLKSEEIIDETESGAAGVLYLASMAEENILTKIVYLSSGNKTGNSLEQVYNSRIVRKH